MERQRSPYHKSPTSPYYKERALFTFDMNSPLPPSLEPAVGQPVTDEHSTPITNAWYTQPTQSPKLIKQPRVDLDSSIGESVYAILKRDWSDEKDGEKSNHTSTCNNPLSNKNAPVVTSSPYVPRKQKHFPLSYKPLITKEQENLFGNSFPSTSSKAWKSALRKTSSSSSEPTSPALQPKTKGTGLKSVGRVINAQNKNLSDYLNTSLSSATDLLQSRRNTHIGVAEEPPSFQSESDLSALGSGPRRRTIAPLNTLDTSIELRKKKIRAKTLPEVIDEEAVNKNISKEEETDISSLKRAPEPDTKPVVSKRSESLPDRVEENHSQDDEEMKTAFRKVRNRFVSSPQTEFSSIPKSPEEIKRRERFHSVKNDGGSSRKRADSFGSKILRRAKSVVTRQPKKPVDDSRKSINNNHVKPANTLPARSMFYEQNSFDDDSILSGKTSGSQVLPASSSIEDSLEFPYPFNNPETSSIRTVCSVSAEITMQGDLHRRKLGHWVSSWAVLTADRIFTLFKSKEVFEEIRRIRSESEFNSAGNYVSMNNIHDTNSGVILSVNLTDGCELENINQTKNKVTFNMVPHTYHSLPPGVSTTLSYEAGLWTDKPVQLMCKNNSEFLYWVKAFVQLNSPGSPRSPRDIHNHNSVRSHREVNGRNHNSSEKPPKNKINRRSLSTRTERNLRVDKQQPSRKTVIYTSKSARDLVGASGMSTYQPPEVTQSTSFNFTSPKSSITRDTSDIQYIDDREYGGLKSSRRVKRQDKVKSSESLEKDITPVENVKLGEEKVPSEENLLSLELSSSPSVKSAELVFASHEFVCCDNKRKNINKNNNADKASLGLSKGEQEIAEKFKKLGTNSPDDQNDQPAKTCFRCKEETDESIEEKERNNKNISSINSNEIHKEKQTDMKNDVKTKTTNHKETKAITNDDNLARKEESNVDVQTLASIDGDKTGDIFSRGIVESQVQNSANPSEPISSSDDAEVNNVINTRDKSQLTPVISIECEESSSDHEVESSSSEENNNSVVLHKNITVKPKSLLTVDGKNNIKKQKSLRQRVLRKLGARNSLSSSTPNLHEDNSESNTTLKVLDIKPASSSTPSSPIRRRRTKKKKVVQEPVEQVEISRSMSEGDIAGSVNLSNIVDGKRKKMRTFRNSRQLSRDNFIETYGVITKKNNGIEYQPNSRHSMIEVGEYSDFSQSDISDVSEDGHSRSQHESTSDSAGSLTSNEGVSTYSSGNMSQGRTTSSESTSNIHNGNFLKVPRKSKSTGSDGGLDKDSTKENANRYSWLSNLAHFPKRNSKAVSSASSSSAMSGTTGRKAAVFRIPASQFAAAAHRGYLDRRNRKKQWERFWCVLQDSCLYCYNSPQSEFTQDAVVLRGYDVIADVTNMHRTRFTFRLERSGSPTLYFSSENHQEFLLWVGTLERETSNVLTNVTDSEVLVQSVRSSASLPNVNESCSPSTDQSPNAEPLSEPCRDEQLNKQKEKLLREVLAQQQKIIDEHANLHPQQDNKSEKSLSTLPQHPRLSKNVVIEKYDKAKSDKEANIMKSMTHLNRRRNSAQLKLDQVTRELAPRHGRKRRENPQQFAEMESRLKEMQQRLLEIDREIQEERAKNKEDIEKLQQKRDLELLVLEQKETIGIIRRHHENRRLNGQDKEVPDNRLSSIEETTAVSDTSSNSEHIYPITTPKLHSKNKNYTLRNQNDISEASNVAAHSSASTEDDDVTNRSNMSSVDEGINYNRSFSQSSNDEVFSRNSVTANIPDSVNNNNIANDKIEEINPSILAEIEEFITFSKEKRKALV